MVVVRSVKSRDLHGGRQGVFELVQQKLDAIHHGDNVGTRLALNVDDDGRECRSSRQPGGRSPHRRNRRHICHLYRGTVAVSHHEWGIIRAGKQLVIGANLV